jgi:hypothetical protein
MSVDSYVIQDTVKEIMIGWLWSALMVVLPDKPQAVPAYGRKMLSMVSYGRKRPFADIVNIFEEIGILMEVKN